ncbi:MAG: hypothetical protein A2383_01740 [Candidatus Pacebacteria bacterium RIFOXYB1_FULL_39_46]|nr:MAG: hypothetical protein A2182_03255 [Candidatus Pacebacteria bacterium RIFOXYA1_FULL_38_18]OGJ37891.1 MAG: hypothetical protein A2383_01740 [Candidatus Pacebacteria bacterium RIFOXYB1_FULL_39_46]OGJ39490.1 MAG: hypothetical protein A2411_01895 [Candidatus Pacebacteria bacterium RIFOXYC1_FULL_39_21]OGJ40070.1 MAG: hypothetical protein A2582_03185 [Candidatus Pacebacteria bacterium RIFOXYD1_FULL_39_27]
MKVISASFQLTKKQFFWSTIVVLLITILLRFYRLGEVPHGMTWDEAAIGYNGFAIFTTRRDEWLTRLPTSFWSFGDYKAPLAIYLNGIFTYLGGMNLWAVRLPFALSGVMAVLGMIYLVRILAVKSGENLQRARLLALLAGSLLALSPWHHHFSRVGFESGLALTLVIWAIYFFYKALAVKKVWRRYLDFLLAILGFTASLYAYHSAKITVPGLVLFLIIEQRKQLVIYWKSFLTAVGVGLLVAKPLIYDSLFGKGLERAGTLIFNETSSIGQTLTLIISNFATHLSTPFLLQGATTTLRHGDGRWGVLLFTTFCLVIVGLCCLLFKQQKKIDQMMLGKLGLLMMILGILPAALGSEVPHSNRSLLSLPGFILLAVFGLQSLFASNFSAILKNLLLGSFILFHGLFFISYLHHYYTVFAAASAAAFQDGYLEAFRFVLPYEKGEQGKTAVDKIIFTSDYGQPYIYALFVRKTNPIWYQGGSLVKYEFKEEINIGDVERPNTIVVASQTDDLLSKNFSADKVILGSDGSERFRIYINQ